MTVAPRADGEGRDTGGAAGARAHFGLRPVTSLQKDVEFGAIRTNQYQVTNLPPGCAVRLREWNARWQLRVDAPPPAGAWTGDYATAGDAFNALEAEYVSSAAEPTLRTAGLSRARERLVQPPRHCGRLRFTYDRGIARIPPRFGQRSDGLI